MPLQTLSTIKQKTNSQHYHSKKGVQGCSAAAEEFPPAAFLYACSGIVVPNVCVCVCVCVPNRFFLASVCVPVVFIVCGVYVFIVCVCVRVCVCVHRVCVCVCVHRVCVCVCIMCVCVCVCVCVEIMVM